MTEGEREKVSNRTWHFPCHPVFNHKKPDKMRVVFDAAVKNMGQSLNSS